MDYWEQFDGSEYIHSGDVYIWGDYKYGGDDKDKDLWGDADLIYGGTGNASTDQYIYAGDGDDTIHQGANW